MDKSELIKGDIVTLKNGDKLLFTGFDFIDLSDNYDNGLSTIVDLNDDMTYEDRKDNKNDIVKVSRPVMYCDVYIRKESKKMTIAQISKELGYDIEIIKEEN